MHLIEEMLHYVHPSPDDETERFVAAIVYGQGRAVYGERPARSSAISNKQTQRHRDGIHFVT